MSDVTRQFVCSDAFAPISANRCFELRSARSTRIIRALANIPRRDRNTGVPWIVIVPDGDSFRKRFELEDTGWFV